MGITSDRAVVILDMGYSVTYVTIMRTYDYTLTKFGAGEAERISGVSIDLQKQWRARGHLPPLEGAGKARFDCYDLARILVMAQMAERGIGPAHSGEIAEIASGSVVYGSLKDPAAFAGDPGGDDDAFLVVRRTARNPVHKKIAPNPLLIIWADGSEWWGISYESALAHIPRKEMDSKLCGPVTILNQFYVGELLLRRAGRALVSVKAA
jgi:hypothetical protein